MSQQQIDETDIGPPPADYQQAAKDAVRYSLKDPDSAVFEFPSEPEKRYISNPYPQHGGVVKWRLLFRVNAKNSYGGYTGFHEWSCVFRDGYQTGCDDITAAGERIQRYLHS